MPFGEWRHGLGLTYNAMMANDTRSELDFRGSGDFSKIAREDCQ
jgi:hypothetical protein